MLRRLEWQIKRFANLHVQGSRPNVFVFSTARSGSTWLMEMIATQPGVKFIDEPFLLDRFRGTKGPLPDDWAFLLPNPEREPAIERYFERLLSGRIGIGAPRPFQRFYRPYSNRLVFKILRCKDLMSWFESRFGAQIVYLLRHPLPVAISRTQYARAPLFLENDSFCERFVSEEQRSYGRKLLASGGELEKRVLDWCLQNLAPLRFLDRSSWVCVHYEDLVLDPERTVSRLASALDFQRPERMLARVRIASGSTVQSTPDTRELLERGAGADRADILSRWRARCAPDDERRAFDVLDMMGIDCYARGEDAPVRRIA